MKRLIDFSQNLASQLDYFSGLVFDDMENIEALKKAAVSEVEYETGRTLTSREKAIVEREIEEELLFQADDRHEAPFFLDSMKADLEKFGIPTTVDSMLDDVFTNRLSPELMIKTVGINKSVTTDLEVWFGHDKGYFDSFDAEDIFKCWIRLGLMKREDLPFEDTIRSVSEVLTSEKDPFYIKKAVESAKKMAVLLRPLKDIKAHQAANLLEAMSTRLSLSL